MSRSVRLPAPAALPLDAASAVHHPLQERLREELRPGHVASVYMSLYLSDVVIVAPLTSLSPLYSLVLSAVFLREVEVITVRRVVAAGLIVLGAVLITASISTPPADSRRWNTKLAQHRQQGIAHQRVDLVDEQHERPVVLKKRMGAS